MYKNKQLKKCENVLQFNILYTDNDILNNHQFGDFDKLDAIKNKIDNVDQDKWTRIRKYTNNYEAPFYNTNKKVISRAFYKLWEIIHDYKINCNTETLHLCEAPGGFIQAVIEYKSQKYNIIKKCHTISLIDTKLNVPNYHQSILKNINVNIIKHKECNLYNIDTILYIHSLLKNKKISLITSDGGITDNGDYNNKEVIHVRLIISEIFSACLILDDFGDFILKIFDIYTDITSHIIYLLNYLFNEVTISKPLTSRPTNSEKYLVCKGYNKEKFTVKIKNEIFKCLNVLNENNNIKVYSLFDNIDDSFIKQIKEYNEEFTSQQIININKNLQILNNEKTINIYNYIGKRNYYSRNWLIKYRLLFP